MSEAKSASNTKRSQIQGNTHPTQKRRSYGYGLGRFFKSKQQHGPVIESEGTHSFERGYN